MATIAPAAVSLEVVSAVVRPGVMQHRPSVIRLSTEAVCIYLCGILTWSFLSVESADIAHLETWARLTQVVGVACAVMSSLTAVLAPWTGRTRYIYTYLIGVHRWVAMTLVAMVGYVLLGEAGAGGLEQSLSIPIFGGAAVGWCLLPIDFRIPKQKDD